LLSSILALKAVPLLLASVVQNLNYQLGVFLKRVDTLLATLANKEHLIFREKPLQLNRPGGEIEHPPEQVSLNCRAAIEWSRGVEAFSQDGFGHYVEIVKL
jgi:hypothetical protein